MLTNQLMPPAGLGRLYHLYELLQQLNTKAQDYMLVLFAADNGVSVERTSFYEPFQTVQLVRQQLCYQSPTGKLLQRLGKEMHIIDVGLVESVSGEKVLQRRIRAGSGNFLYEDALTQAEVRNAITTGMDMWDELNASCFDIIGVGEMGVGDTLCASACAAAACGWSADLVTGRGSGDHKVIAKKVDIINRACLLRSPRRGNVVDILARFGGLEIAALTGFMLGAAARKTPVMLDGFVTTVAALLASKIDPATMDWLIAPSLTGQRGHAAILAILNIEPVMDLDINYGEGLAATLGLFMAEMCMRFCSQGDFQSEDSTR